MVRIDDRIDIDRPVEEVFAFITDPDRLGEWQTTTISAVKQTDGPMRAGTLVREVRSAPLGKQVESLVEVAEYEPNRVFGLRMLEGPLKIDGTYRFEGQDGRTHLEFDGGGELNGPMRLAAPLLTRVLRRQFAGYHRRLKAVLEAR
jgi:ligand-binding SRPBCC domain-containing protein